ncbi:MAG: triple tyrosine motif-containing protein, partial [Rhodothermales bacterium]
MPNQSFINARFLVDSRGDVWVSGDYGLSRWDGARWTTFTTDDGLAAAEPYFMAEDQSGRLWFGYHSSHGITVYDGSTFTTYTTDDGLFNDAVYSVGVDQRDNIWIGTARGVDRFDGETFVNYGPAEGYASESNAGGFFADHDGTLWFGTAEGLSHYDPRYDLSSSGPPHVKIHRLWLGGAAERVDAAITVPYVRRDLQATVVALSYINPKKLTLRYRLTGYDEAWRALEGREIHYTNLPAGQYTLEVQARKQQSGWSASAMVGFQIEKPYWQTWWFRISVMLTLFLLTLGTVVVVYRVQRRRFIRRERQRAEIEQAQLRAQASKAEAATAQAREAEAHARALQAENERKELEREKARETAHLVEQLKRSNEELEQFASLVSHDLQEPLRTITSFVALLKMRYQGQLDEDADTFIGYITEGSARMLALIRDLLSVSRLGRQELEYQAVDMRAVLEWTLAGIQTALEEADAEVIIDPLPTVEGDATQLGMV